MDMGQIAYNHFVHYQKHVNNTIVDSWDELEQQDKDAWRTAAEYLLSYQA